MIKLLIDHTINVTVRGDVSKRSLLCLGLINFCLMKGECIANFRLKCLMHWINSIRMSFAEFSTFRVNFGANITTRNSEQPTIHGVSLLKKETGFSWNFTLECKCFSNFYLGNQVKNV